MIVLDTDHFNILEIGKGEQYDRLTARMFASTDKEFATTVITFEELMRGWLAAVQRQRKITQQIRPYDHLILQIRFFASWQILRFNEGAADRFQNLRSSGIRIGTQDLKIASIVLELGASLLTANGRDFEQVPGLKTENWIH